MAHFHTIFTLLVMIIFVGVLVWAFAPRRKAYFEQASRLPFQAEDRPPATADQQAGERS